MYTPRTLLLNLLVIAPLCYAADTDMHKLNRQLVQIVSQEPERVEDYRYHVDYQSGCYHPISNLTIHTMVHDWKTEYQVVDNNNASVIWSLSQSNKYFQEAPSKAIWFDETGERIALRYPAMDPFHPVFRVSFLSELKQTDYSRHALLQDAVDHFTQHRTGHPINYDNTTYRLYSGLPSVLRFSQLFNLSCEAKLSVCLDTSRALFAALKRACLRSCYDGILERIP
jgi:hypothetical protein